MPIPFTTTAISRNYPDIAVNPDKYFIEKNLSISIGIFSLRQADLAASASLQPIRGGRDHSFMG